MAVDHERARAREGVRGDAGSAFRDLDHQDVRAVCEGVGRDGGHGAGDDDLLSRYALEGLCVDLR